MKQLFTFNNNAAAIYPFLKDIIAFIDRYSPGNTNELSFKARVIITELLTNSIKHTTGSLTGVELSINDKALIIKKIDEGGPFYLKGTDITWPLTAMVENTLTIYKDALNGLFARVTAPYCLSFYTESYPDEDVILTDISEHFGLVIICRASSAVLYQYNPASNQSIFTVTIPLN